MARRFGATWWGRAWTDALEHRAQLDPNRLPRGRTYARQDRVARLDIAPGRITALVRGSRVLPYKVTVEVATYDDGAWERVAAVVAGRAGHAAALLDGVLEPEILADAEEAGVGLLPGAGDLRPRCSCPDWADPCKHASAVCYLVADALDGDPFVLFQMRGRSREAFLDAVRRWRRSGVSPPVDELGRQTPELLAGGALEDPGMVAREAWARDLGATPERRELPRTPGSPAAWPAEPPPDAPFSAEGLTELATDAAQRAWAQLAEGASSHLQLTVEQDLARRADDQLQRADSLFVLARRTGRSPAQLANRALAWRHAGVEALAAIDAPSWRPPPAVIDLALAAFAEGGTAAGAVTVRSNRFSVGDVQLRVTEDGRWWRYERQGRNWELVEPPADDPVELISD